MEKAPEILQTFLDEEIKRAVFAAFPDLRSVASAHKETFSTAVEKIRKNEMFVAAQKAGADMGKFKGMLVESMIRNTKLLSESFFIAIDLAIDKDFIPNPPKKEK